MKDLIQRLPAILLTLSSLTTFAQNNLDKLGLTATAPASAAYGLRLLSSNYSGNAIQVRRSSDNATQAIGFTGGGDLDTNALKSFTGVGDGFISIWYDQSGNAKDLSQPTASHQPAIVNAGTIYRENARPFIRFFGVIASSNYRSLNLAAQMTVVGHISAVHRFEPTGDGFILGHTGVYYWHSNAVSTLISSVYASTSVQGGSGWTNGTPYTPVSMPWPSVLSINEIAPATANSLTNWDNIGTDRITAHNTTGGGGYSELVIFPAALSTGDRTTLETNQASYFAINGILPVSWISFSGNKNQGAISLEWQTAAEQNTRDFTVQRSTNGNQWSDIATVPASGNSNNVQTYAYRDEHPLNGRNFYRILQTDRDDRKSYSKTIQLNFEGDQSSFRVIGNPPVNGLLQVEVNRQQTLSLYDADGRLTWKKRFNNGVQEIPVAALAKGIYVLKGEGATIKILIQ